jgi:hypothetical protein
MNTISILKIETDDKVVLVSNNATQDVFPSFKGEIIRNLDSIMLPQRVRQMKYRSSIETSDPPDLSAISFEKTFTIYSIVKFQEYGRSEPSIRYVSDSLERRDTFITFRPVLQTKLLDFRCTCKSSGIPSWKLEFEET